MSNEDRDDKVPEAGDAGNRGPEGRQLPGSDNGHVLSGPDPTAPPEADSTPPEADPTPPEADPTPAGITVPREEWVAQPLGSVPFPRGDEPPAEASGMEMAADTPEDEDAGHAAPPSDAADESRDEAGAEDAEATVTAADESTEPTAESVETLDPESTVVAEDATVPVPAGAIELPPVLEPEGAPDAAESVIAQEPDAAPGPAPILADSEPAPVVLADTDLEPEPAVQADTDPEPEPVILPAAEPVIEDVAENAGPAEEVATTESDRDRGARAGVVLPDADSQWDPVGGGGGGGAAVGRRDIFKGLVSLPVLGALGYGAWNKKALEDARKAAIFDELGVTGEAPAIIDHAITSPPADRVRLGIIGVGGEGEALLRGAGFAHPEVIEDWREAAARNPRHRRLEEFVNQGDLNVELTAICDVFDVRAERGVAISSQPERPGGAQARPAARYDNYEELLASDDVDAVIIATPDHWHAQMTIDAASAGKHVYCEKCMTRAEEEVVPMVEAVRAAGIKFQLGHQNRQLESHEKAREIVDKGILGPITLVETTTNRNSPWGAWVWDIHPEGSAETIDWEQFEGPAPNKVPFNLERFFRWRCWYDYGTGLAGDLLSHEFDAVNQILGLGVPHSAVASGGIYHFKDGRDVPDVFQVAYEYPDRDLTLIYSATLANGRGRGKVFMGHDATMEVGSGVRVIADGESTRYADMLEREVIDPSRPLLTYTPGYKGLDAVTTATEEYFASRGLLFTYQGGRRVSTHWLHIKEWLDAIRDGGETSCDIERGLEEAIACHMATRSYLEGRKVVWDAENQVIV